MPKHKSRGRRDVNEIAAQVVAIATGQIERPPAPNQRAVNRGKARAASLTARRRREIARKAARARWSKGKKG